MSYASALGSTLIKENVDTIITGAIGYKFAIQVNAPPTASGTAFDTPAIVLPQGVWAVLGNVQNQATTGTITNSTASTRVDGVNIQTAYNWGADNVVDGIQIAGVVTSDGTNQFQMRIIANTSGLDTWFSNASAAYNLIYVVRIA